MTGRKQIYSGIIGAVLILIGFLLPSDTLIEFLRGESFNAVGPVLRDKLLFGALLFRLSLGVLGIAVVVSTKIFDDDSAPPFINLPSQSGASPQVFILGALLFIGLGLRLYCLHLGLWFDEITAYVNYARLPIGELLTTYDSENQHFFYTLLAHLCLGIFGDTGWAVRLPAAIFGVGSLFAVYLVGRQLLSERESLLAMALLTFSYHHIWFSQNARGYTGVLFFSLLSSWLFLVSMKTNQTRWWLGYALSSALGVFTHITMIFVIVSHFIMYFITIIVVGKDVKEAPWKGFVEGFVLSGLLTFQLHALVVPQIFSTIGQTTMVKTWHDPIWTIIELLNGMQIGLEGGLVVLLGGMIFLGVGTWNQFKDSPYLVGFFILPAILGTSIVLGMGHPLWPRFFFFLVGFAALILVRGLMLFGKGISKYFPISPQRGVYLGTMFCVGLVTLSAISAKGAYAPKQDYQGALHFVEEHRQAGDAVVAVGLAEFPYKRFYETNWDVAKNLEELNSIRAKSLRTWLVFTMPMHLKAYHPDIMSETSAEFAEVRAFPGTLGEGTVFVYRSDAPHSLKKLSRME